MQADNSLIVQLAAMLLTAGAIYGGIRSELRSMHEAIARLERALEKAHRRIDDVVVHGGRRNGDAEGVKNGICDG